MMRQKIKKTSLKETYLSVLPSIFDFETADIRQDLRHGDEIRLIAVGRIRFHIYTMVFTERGTKTRVISLRRSNKKEKQLWQKNLTRF